jgi:monoamine oxidase
MEKLRAEMEKLFAETEQHKTTVEKLRAETEQHKTTVKMLRAEIEQLEENALEASPPASPQRTVSHMQLREDFRKQLAYAKKIEEQLLMTHKMTHELAQQQLQMANDVQFMQD